MRIILDVMFNEEAMVGFLNFMGMHNAALIVSTPNFPLLYDTGIIYLREEDEHFRDATSTLLRGAEDCDSLAPFRMGELKARGWMAMRPGDEGYELAAKLKPKTIDAWIVLTTGAKPGERGMYHVEVRYQIGNRTYADDPSLRLGMRNEVIDPVVLARWKSAGVRRRIPSDENARYVPIKQFQWG